MKVELVEINKVIPYARNPRNNESAVAKVTWLIKKYYLNLVIVYQYHAHVLTLVVITLKGCMSIVKTEKLIESMLLKEPLRLENL